MNGLRPMTTFQIRPYEGRDAESWLRCRVLGFLRTDYYDDVVIERPEYDRPSIRLVADNGTGNVVGLMDVGIVEDRATIEVLAVHPDHHRKGIATALLETAIDGLQDHSARTLDAWTREDAAANAWYRRSGFSEVFGYLHVYKGHDDDNAGFETPDGLSAPLHAFMHASRDREAEMRQRFRRVHVCRRYLLDLPRRGA